MSSEGHKSSQEGQTCSCCWDDITTENNNYVEYRAVASGDWLPSGYCQGCIEVLLSSQWQNYIKSLETTTCKAEMRRLLERGPPINIRDPKALPCPNDGEVFELWYQSDNQVHSAKLTGSLEGKEREVFWNEKSAFYVASEPEETELAGDLI